MILRFGNKWVSWGGNLLRMPTTLFTYIMSAFSNGFTRNMALSSIGNHDNALMGSYLLATTNSRISIVGFLATDQVIDIGTGLEMTNITKTSGLITLQGTAKYGAFEIHRVGALIGRYCLTERLGSLIINQYRGAGYLPNGLINGTLTNIWQKSNAYYAETNKTGYSIAGTGWAAKADGSEALTKYSFIPADLDNPSKCLAWVGGVQQDLQFAGKARNNVSLVPISHYFNNDRYYLLPPFGTTVTKHVIEMYILVLNNTTAFIYGGGENNTYTHSRNISISSPNTIRLTYYNKVLDVSVKDILQGELKIVAGYDNGLMSIQCTSLKTGKVYYNSANYTAGPITIASAGFTRVGGINNTNTYFGGYIGYVTETFDASKIFNIIFSQHGSVVYNTASKLSYSINGVSVNIIQNVNCGIFPHISQGYELWSNGTDYQIYPLADDGTRIITPAGYTLVETVAPNTMPSVADIRLSTVKYSLANSNELYKSVPEAFNNDATITPKVMSYSELSALTNNIKVTKTESNGKITNLTIRQ